MTLLKLVRESLVSSSIVTLTALSSATVAMATPGRDAAPPMSGAGAGKGESTSIKGTLFEEHTFISG